MPDASRTDRIAAPADGAGLRPAWILAAITLLAVAVRLFGLTGSSMWADEGFTLQIVVVERQAFLSGILSDIHPPLYYAGLLAWSGLFGQGEFALRAFGALLGAATVPLLYGIGRMLAGERVGLVAALLLALSPLHVQYSAELRMYGLMVLAAAVLLWGATRFATAPAEPRARMQGLAMFLAGSFLLLGTQIAGLFVIAAGGLFMIAGWWLAGRPRDAVRPFLVAQAGLAVLLLLAAPLYLTLMGNARGLFSWVPRPSPGLVAEVIGSLLAQRLSDLLPRPALAAVGALVLGAAALGLWAARRERLVLAFALLVGAVPFALTIGVSLALQPVFLTRIHVWSLLPLYVLVGIGVVAFRPRFLGLAALAAVLVVQAAGLYSYNALWGRPDWRGVAAVIAADWRPTDRVVIPPSPGSEALMVYYAPDVAGRVTLLRSSADLPGLRPEAPGERRWVVSAPWHDRVPPAAVSETLTGSLQPREPVRLRLISVQLWSAGGRP